MIDPVERRRQVRVEHPQPLGSLAAALRVWKIASIASWQPRPGRNPYDFGSNRASHSGSSALTTRACSTGRRSRESRVGAAFRCAFGMYTRLTGTGLPRLGGALHRSRPARPWPPAVSATSPSMPAVLRPALRCVTCRTLTSVFDRDRSISFCRLRTVSGPPPATP